MFPILVLQKSDLCACKWRQGHRIPQREEAGTGVVEAISDLSPMTISKSILFPENSYNQSFHRVESYNMEFPLATAANATRVVGNRTFLVCPDDQTETCLSIMGHGEWGAARSCAYEELRVEDVRSTQRPRCHPCQ